MNRLLYIVLAVLSLIKANGQNFVEISVGQGYSKYSYYRLTDNTQASIDDDSWDLAFSAFGFQDAGVFLNEGSASNFQAPVPELELYAAPTNNFNDTFKIDNLGMRFYNDELNWSYGAGNTGRNVANPFDYGWGTYNPATMQVTGGKVFVIKLRNGQYKKFMIESLILTTYNLKYANLDGSDPKAVQINKMAYANKDFALFSFETGTAISTPLKDWELAFLRYATPLDDGTGNILQYAVTGALIGPGIKAAKIATEDTSSVIPSDYLDSLTTRTDIIGHDWKYFDFTKGWIVHDSLVYFVKTKDGNLWKINFIDFEGSSTGNIVLVSTNLGMVTAIHKPLSALAGFDVFPNPAEQEVTIALELKDPAQVKIAVTNSLGQVMWSSTSKQVKDLTVWNLPVNNWAKGIYSVSVYSGTEVSTKKLLVQ